MPALSRSAHSSCLENELCEYPAPAVSLILSKPKIIRKGKQYRMKKRLTRPSPTLKQETFQRNEERAWLVLMLVPMLIIMPVLMADADNRDTGIITGTGMKMTSGVLCRYDGARTSQHKPRLASRPHSLPFFFFLVAHYYEKSTHDTAVHHSAPALDSWPNTMRRSLIEMARALACAARPPDCRLCKLGWS